MARAKTRYRYIRPKRKSYRRGGGGWKDVIDGFIAGLGGQLASKWIGGYGHPAVTLATGIIRKNTTLKCEGARELGAMIATQIPFIGGQSPYSGGY